MNTRPVFSGWLLFASAALLLVSAVDTPNVRGQSGAPGNIVSFSLPVSSREAQIYSGPGSQYYSTGVLAQNTVVEVFLRRPDGWCAIKPPQGSYSWVNGQFLQKGADQIAVVNNGDNKEVPVRVGTDSIMKSSVIQVGLKTGKRVRVLGETKLPGGSVWYKIVPPAGEFRWIQDKDLLADPAIKQLPSKLMLTQDYLDTVMGDQTTVSAPHLERPATSAIAATAPAANSTSSSGSASLPGSANPTILSDGTGHEIRIPPMNSRDTDPFALEIARLNGDLYTMANGNATNTNCDILAERAKALFNAAGDDEQRLAAKKAYDQVEQLRAAQTNSGARLAMAGPRNGSINANSGNIHNYNNSSNYNSNNSNNNAALAANPTNGGQSANKEKQPFFRPRQRITRPEKKNDPNRMHFAFGGNHTSGSTSAPIPQTSVQTASNAVAPVASTVSAVQTPAPVQVASRNTGYTPRGKQLLPTPVGKTTVPPPDYVPYTPTAVYTAQATTPATLSSTVPNASSAVNAAPVMPGPQTLPQTQPQTLPQTQPQTLPQIKPQNGILNAPRQAAVPTPLSDNGQKPILPGPVLSSPIKQVSAVLPVSSPAESSVASVEDEDDVRTWQPPVELLKQTRNIPVKTLPTARPLQTSDITKTTAARIVPTATANTAGAFDALGILGYLPKSQPGYPPYVLVERSGSDMNILCYVQSESGRKLDQFVGKTVGVKGTRGIIKDSNGNATVITAKTIFTLKQH